MADAHDAVNAGLCASCRCCRTISARSSTYYFCRRSLEDSAYPRYPQLPVVACPGYEAVDGPDDAAPAPVPLTDA